MSCSIPLMVAVTKAMPGDWLLHQDHMNELIDVLGKIERFNADRSPVELASDEDEEGEA